MMVHSDILHCAMSYMCAWHNLQHNAELDVHSSNIASEWHHKQCHHKQCHLSPMPHKQCNCHHCIVCELAIHECRKCGKTEIQWHVSACKHAKSGQYMHSAWMSHMWEHWDSIPCTSKTMQRMFKTCTMHECRMCGNIEMQCHASICKQCKKCSFNLCTMYEYRVCVHWDSMPCINIQTCKKMSNTSNAEHWDSITCINIHTIH